MGLNYNGKLIIFTSFYKQQTISAYCESLVITALTLRQLGINFDYWGRPGDFHIERAINHALSMFAEDPEATDFLNIDSDQSWTADSVVKLLVRPEPIICGSYKQTGGWAHFTGLPSKDKDGNYLGKITGENTAILEAWRIPAGFLRIKKEVVQRFKEVYPDEWFYLEPDHGFKVWKFFWNEIKNHLFTGMDYALSDKLTAMGYQLWIDPSLQIGHWGITEYTGTLDAKLRADKAVREAKEAISGHGTV